MITVKSNDFDMNVKRVCTGAHLNHFIFISPELCAHSDHGGIRVAVCLTALI